MTVFFRESFNGTGALEGVEPQINIAPGLQWTASGNPAIFMSNGEGGPGNPTNSNELSIASIGDQYTPRGRAVPIRITFSMRTPPFLGNVDGNSHGGVVLITSCGGRQNQIRVWGYNNGSSIAWYMNMDSGSPFSIITSQIAADTVFDGVIDIDDGIQTFTFAGTTISTTAVLPDATIGFSGVTLSVYGYSKIANIEVNSNVDGNGDIEPASTLSAFLFAPKATLDASATFTNPAGESITFAGTAPRGTLVASITGANVFSFAGGPPMGTLSAYTGAVAALTAPSPLLSATLKATNILSAALTAPSPLLSATGVVPQVMRASLTAPMGSIRAFTGAVARLTAPSSPVLSASITAGNKLTATIMAPLFELTATATQRNKLDANLTAPSGYLVKGAVARLTAPMGQLTAIGSAVISVIYEAYALNLNHKPRGNEMPVDEMTHYTNFPFDRIVRYKDRYYGMSSSGLYLLGGATDDGAPIQWDVKTCMTDFSSVFLKTVTAAYFGGRLGPSATVDLHVGEAGTLTYSYTTPLGTDAQNYRQVFGKGVKDRYYALGVKGTGAFSLDSITLSVSELSRRI